MPDTSSLPSHSRKLGGIPQADSASSGIYRKPPAFKMQTIPRPAVRVVRAGQPRRKKSGWPGVLVFLALLIGGGGYLYLHQPPQLAAWLKRLREPSAPETYLRGPAPADTSPIADASNGWEWLFPEAEWRAISGERGVFRGGLVHLQAQLEKPQPSPDGAIRARIVIRDGESPVGVMMRSTSEHGRYSFFLDPDLRRVRLVHRGPKETTEIAKYSFFKSFFKGDHVTLELKAEGEKLFGLVNDAVVIEAEDSRSKEAGSWGIESNDGWYELVEVPPVKPVMVAAATPVPQLEEPAAPMPAATPAPVPVQSETAKWLASMEPQWQASFEQEVTAAFDQGVSGLKAQLLSTIDSQMASATQAGRRDDASFLRGERQRLEGGEDVPMKDEAIVPPAIRSLRNTYRSNFIRLDTDRYNRAKGFHARIDVMLAQSEAALAQRQRGEEAAEVKAKREQLAALWLKPPAKLPPPPGLAATELPPLGSMTSPASVEKLSPHDVVEKLLGLGASVWVNQRGDRRTEITEMTELAGDKFTILRVDFPRTTRGEKPLTADDYAILDHLSDVNELTLRGGGAVTEMTMEKLRAFRDLQRLRLEGLTGFKAAGYSILPALSSLQELELVRMSPSDDAMKSVSECRKVQRLVLGNLPIGDEVFASVAAMPSLTELVLNDLDKITSPAIVHLEKCRSLRRLVMGGFTVTSSMLEAVARFGGLESLTLSGNQLKDDQIVPLSGLVRLQTLGLNGTQVVGTAFAKWPTRSSMTGLNLAGAPGVDDEALKGIASAFPKLETLEFKVAPLGASAVGFSAVGRLRHLRTLRIGGEGVNDEAAAEIAKSDDIWNLSLGGARLTDSGAAALAKLDKVRDLHIEKPPVTDAALKSFSRMKALRSFTIGDDAPPETEKKLRGALSGVAIRRQ